MRAEWETLDAIRSATVDTFTREEVRTITTDVEALRESVADTRAELEAKRSALEQLTDELDRAEAEITSGSERRSDAREGLVRGGAVAAAGIVVGSAVDIASTPLVGYAIAGVALLLGLYYIRSRIDEGERPIEAEPVRELKTKRADRRSEIGELERELEAEEAELDAAEEAFGELRARFDLPGTASPAGVREFFDALQTLKADVRDYDTAMERLEEDVAAFERSLDEAARVVREVQQIEWDPTAPREDTGTLYRAVERLTDAVDVAAELDEARTAYEERENEAVALVEAWCDSTRDGDGWRTSLPETLDAYAAAAAAAETYESTVAERDAIREDIRREFARQGVRDAFRPIAASQMETDAEASRDAEVDGGTTPDTPVEGAKTGETEPGHELEDRAVPLLRTVADSYPTRAELEDRLESIDAEIGEVRTEKDGLRDDRAELNEQLKELASDEDIREAAIQRHRETLRARAEEYATNRLGEFILDRLHDRFIEQATGPLLDDASDIFARITDEYDGIDQEGELDSLDFVAEQLDGSALETGALSRATREQLFLSVRLARIRQLDVELPVVLDDAMTNFDPAHTRRTLAFLDELAGTNQVIVLTCHPGFAEIAAEQATVEDFWCLDGGRFSGPHDDPEPVYEVLDARPV